MIVTQGKAGVTETVATTDTAAALPDSVLYSDGNPGTGAQAIAVYISVEANDARYGFNVDPTQAGLGHVLTAGDSIRIVGVENVQAFKVISSGAGAASSLQVTPEYGHGVAPSD